MTRVTGFVEAVVIPPAPAPLAFTGSDAGRLLELGILLAGVGAALILLDVPRRRRHEQLIAARARID